MRYGLALAAAWFLGSTGCGRRQLDGLRQEEPTPSPSIVRAERRAYDGAPPVIPHQPFGMTCTQCHDAVGKAIPGVGIAPANPHVSTPGIGTHGRCQQCHLFQQTSDTFVASEFRGLVPATPRGERLYPGAPPVIPHGVFMRDHCAACHGTLATRPEIHCTHLERQNCRQCHVPQAVDAVRGIGTEFESAFAPKITNS